jgi:nucleotide-binding universal stress UspA family protein
MTMFEQILVAIDGSPTGNRGLKAAIGLAAEKKGTLTIVHVVNDLSAVAQVGDSTYMPAAYVDDMLEELQKHGRKVLAKASVLARASGVEPVERLVESRGGSVADAILAEAKKRRADVIVLGTHGRRGLQRMLMGSDAEAVLREARVPVLLVRSGETLARPALRSVTEARRGTRKRSG